MSSYTEHGKAANSVEAEDLEKDGDEDVENNSDVEGQMLNDRGDIEEADEDDDDDEPNETHLSEHTKSLIAHLASLPGFGQSGARISYIPAYSGPEPTGTTLAEIQLPWRSSPTMGSDRAESVAGASGASLPVEVVTSTSSGGDGVQTLVTAPTSLSLRKRNDKTVSLDRRRGTKA